MKSSYLLNDLMNLKDIFRKNVTCDNIKSHEKLGLYPHSRKSNFRKFKWGVNLTPSFLRINIDFFASLSSFFHLVSVSHAQ